MSIKLQATESFYVEENRGAFLSINTRIYTNAFLSKAFEFKEALSDYERFGLYQTIYLSAFNGIESIISEIYRAVARDSRIAFLRNHPGENNLLATVFQELENDIDKASFSKIEQMHQKYLGKKLKDLIGDELYGYVRALNEMRNIFAHGRSLTVELVHDPNAGGKIFTNTDFSKHPLKNTFVILESLGIYSKESARKMQASDVKSLIYKEEAVLTFWKKSQDPISVK